MPPEIGNDGAGGTIFSAGYQGLCLEDFLTRLVDSEIDILVDVRLTPISRKKGFSKKALAEALGERGIVYRHEPSLGNPRDNRDGFQNGSETARKRYEHLLLNGSKEAFESILELMARHRVALLCFEREHSECHRSVITDNIQALNPATEILPV